MDYCKFGAHLDISRETLEIFKTDKSDHYVMMKIFECWKRKDMNRTWKKVLDALTKVGHDVLAYDICNELTARENASSSP